MDPDRLGAAVGRDCHPFSSTVEADLQEMKERSQNLQEAVEAKVLVEQDLRQKLEATERQLEAAYKDLQRSKEAAESLRQELGQLREEYERGMRGHSLFLWGKRGELPSFTCWRNPNYGASTFLQNQAF